MIYPDYPGNPLKLGDNGKNVKLMQSTMNVLFAKFPVYSNIKEDGIFDEDMQSAIIEIQRAVGVCMDGIIDCKEWNTVLAVANFIYEP